MTKPASENAPASGPERRAGSPREARPMVIKQFRALLLHKAVARHGLSPPPTALRVGPTIMRDRPLPTRPHLRLPGTGSRPRTSRPRATSSSSSTGHHIGFLHGGRGRQALLGHRHLSARRRELPRGPLSPLAPERRGHPSLDYCEWTNAEARRRQRTPENTTGCTRSAPAPGERFGHGGGTAFTAPCPRSPA